MGKHHHNLFRLSVILLLFASVPGCSSSGTLRSDYDHGADFGAYKTWDFIEDAGPDYAGYESLFTQYMLEAITIEMSARGYVKSDNPDLLVNFNGDGLNQTNGFIASGELDIYSLGLTWWLSPVFNFNANDRYIKSEQVGFSDNSSAVMTRFLLLLE